jgi:integrase
LIQARLPVSVTMRPQALRIHDLRHTAASLAVSTGANVKAVQRMLGHSTASQTLDRYSRLFTNDLEALATASIWCFVNNTRPQSSEEVAELVV